MSILLTAGRKAALGSKLKKKAPKKKHHVRQAEVPCKPPISSARTSVWHWYMQGIPTTVMFTKSTSEVWCNGEVLETICSFSDDHSGDGGTIDFCLVIDECGLHEAQIKTSNVHGQINTELFVDHYMVLEYVGQDPLEAVVPITMEHAMRRNGAAFPPHPPSYDEVTQLEKKTA